MPTKSLSVILVLASLASLTFAPLALAQTAASAPGAGGPEALEREFWHCDHAATQALLDPGTSERCGLVTDLLKTSRFGGDFQAMLVWWRANKEARHAALETASRRLVRATPQRSAD
ncbi:MAG: hypothetical protein ACK51Z_04155 [Pseudomonadota bacterium]|jgi:hypothetical protein